MSTALAEKIAIITGSGRGLGRAMALGFATAGAKAVILTAARSPDQIEEVAAEIEAMDGPTQSLALLADVTNPGDCQRVAEKTIEAFGTIDVLINNAGKGQNFINDDRIPFWKAKISGWQEIIDTNVNGPFLMAHAVTPTMMAQNKGRIINISKSRDSMHRPMNSPYGASKAALEAMSLSWAQDLLDTGITVNTLAPGGSVDTAFVLPAVREKAAATGKHYFEPEVIVPPAVWLASDASDGITGCRYIGSRWDSTLPDADAAEGAREPAIFLPPRRDSILAKPWEVPEKYS